MERRNAPIFAGVGAGIMGLQCPVEMSLELGSEWKYMGDQITLLASED